MSPNVHRFLEKKEVKVAMSYLLLISRPEDCIAFEKVLETLPGFTKTIVEKLTRDAKRHKVAIKTFLNALID